MEKILFKDRKKEGIFNVGLTIYVQPKDGYKDLKYKSTIIGWKSPDILLIGMPILNGVYVNLQTNCICIIRYIYRGVAYGFESKVIKNINIFPLPILYISYPEVIEEISLRKHKRIDTQIPAQITKILSGNNYNITNDCNINGDILDISIGGCLMTVTSNQNFDIDNQVFITFKFPHNKETLIQHCYIRRIQKVSDNCLLGMQFIDIPEETKKKITLFQEALNNYNMINNS